MNNYIVLMKDKNGVTVKVPVQASATHKAQKVAEEERPDCIVTLVKWVLK